MKQSITASNGGSCKCAGAAMPKPAMKKANPFTGKETKKNETAEMKMAGSKKKYNTMENKYEGKSSTSKKK